MVARANGSASNKCDPEEMDAEDPLFILYTSDRQVNQKGCCILLVVILYMLLTLMK